MSPDVALQRAIARAEAVLPGKPLADPDETDPRWQAIIEIGLFAETHPEAVWQFAIRWGKHPQEDLRAAIGVCLVEPLLEQHFELLFPRVCDAVQASRRFADTFNHAWWYGFEERTPQREALEELRKTCARSYRCKRRR